MSFDIQQFVHRGINLDSAADEQTDQEFWQRISQNVETELWLDSGDESAIEPLWNPRFSGLTTNNSLLNAEVQKGIYDDLIPDANRLLETMVLDDRVREIAFILNTHHALKLVEAYRCDVSVELHTDIADDAEATMAFARRCHAICPKHFIVKVPLTPAGLVAIKQLREEGIRVNCTIGFSARQNYLATAFANPSFVNVFLGRLNSYVADNGLGDGKLVGEQTTLESQREVAVFARGLPQSDTKQIAASLRDAKQLPLLAGVDVITMPPKVAKQARETLQQTWVSRRKVDYPEALETTDADSDTNSLEKLWTVSKQERNLAQKIILNPPSTASELVDAAQTHEIDDLFPQLSEPERNRIAADGKIPKHDRWRDKFANGTIAIDSLMTLAALAHFAADQAKLDARVREQLAK
ncbi:transaldolase family protein [Stieleria tagensis]|uniref:transaldolase family protein n=1 Tax=Stieleria tagensis TaxID=2956795 RepID=UPI00209B565F|nr:transaldolase family protein [Stieleria tagensis]